MNLFPGRRLRRILYSGLSIFALSIFLSDIFGTVLAADDHTTPKEKTSQEPLEVPGSFKDLPDARDAVTAKSVTEQIPVPQSSASAELEIDAQKIARAGGAVFADNELTDFHATAYCLKGRTASGINTRPGVIAADPRVLPLGTVVHVQAGRYTGTYTVMDTGGLIKGRRIDVYVPTYKEAIQFGRQQVKVKVIGRNSTRNASKTLLAAEL